MDAAERARTYATLADSTRRWVSVMDTKAGFMFAVNGALLTFMWTAARLGEVLALARWLAIGASLCSLLALLAALWIIIPRAAIGRRCIERRATGQLLRVRRDCVCRGRLPALRARSRKARRRRLRT
jgi:hypothetical protein